MKTPCTRYRFRIRLIKKKCTASRVIYDGSDSANGTRLRRIVSKGNEWKPFYFALRFGIKAKTE